MMNEQDKKVPTLRFKGFANDWEQRKLSEISDPIRSYSYTRKYETNSVTGFKYIHYGDIHTGNAKEIDDPNELPSIVKGNYSKLTSGDIVVADASEDYKGIADAAILLNPGTFSVIAGLHTIAFRPNTELVFPMFVYYILQTNSFKHYGYHVGTGLKVFGISSKLFFNYLASYPSLTEQQNISKLIKLLENLITLQQRKLDLLKQLKKGLLQKMFADRDSKRPILRFGGFSNDWEQRKLDEIASLEDNKRKPVKESDRVPGKVPYYGANGIQDHVKGYTHTGEHVLVAEDGANSISNYPVYFICSPSWVNNHAHVLTGKELMTSNKFLTYDLMTVHYGKYLVGSGRYKLNAETLKIIPIRIPSLTEQKYIGGVLSKVDNIINLQQQKLKKISKVKESFLQQMFI